MTFGRLGASVTLVALFGIGCSAFDESLLDGGPGDSGPSCPLTRPAPRPAVADGADVDTILYAIREPVLNQSDAWRTYGYDLDGLCSTEASPIVECRAPAASAPPEIDGEGGIDNAFGHSITPIVLTIRPELVDHARGGVAQGLGAILLRVAGWNGAPDDPRVEATFIQAKFGSGEPIDEPIVSVAVADMELVVNGVERDVPQWDGEDFFWARPDGFLGGDISRPRMQDDNAYVAGGRLVMRLPDRFPFLLGGDQSAVIFALTDASFTVLLDPDRRTVRDAVLVGRWPLLDILATIEAGGICPGTGDYEMLARLLDLAADIRGRPGTGGPTAECDAISLALPFRDGIVATLVDALEAFPTPNACADPPDGGAPDAGTDGGAILDGGA